ncbi:MAG: sigma-70 family RNA polymerase sigma factor [Solirubrobacterales bacterium]|nr:sigma-70 family RNA polymerase sigma factor [Solirubrobacterales bacterium]
MALFRAGHDDAFRVIHDRYRQRLFAYTRQMLPHRQDAEDALQDIFVRAYAGLRANHRELALRAWLYRVAHNRCIDELRRPSPPPPEVIELLRSPTHDPIAEADQRESLRRLIADVRRLPDQQRSALLMRELGGMSYADMAAALGVTIPAVKSLLVRARLALAQALEARDTACSEIREALVLSHDRGLRPNATARRHMRDCAGCREFRHQLRGVSRRFAAIVPTLGPLGVLANVLGVGGAGSGAAGGALAAGGAGGTGTAVTGTAVTGTAVTGTAVVGVGTMTAGATHVATLLAAAVVTAGGAVELQHNLPAAPRHVHQTRVAAAARARPSAAGPAAPASANASGAPAAPPAVISLAAQPQVSRTAAEPAPPSAPASTQIKPSPSTSPRARAKHQPKSTGGISTVISVGGATASHSAASPTAPATGTSATSTTGSTSSGTASTTQPTGTPTDTTSDTPSSSTTSPTQPAALSTSTSGGSTGTATGTGSSAGAATGGSLAPAQ